MSFLEMYRLLDGILRELDVASGTLSDDDISLTGSELYILRQFGGVRSTKFMAQQLLIPYNWIYHQLCRYIAIARHFLSLSSYQKIIFYANMCLQQSSPYL
ncbi:hypothetical protein A7U60_g3108 [Sanghuangporus baumii]|uniref:Uncharacterized protein n=1 Tax=Sanghuangporus baumii TaxID=108892 RepID=A0A9Q5I1F6_SANBA|nr:hypothetical protein A7U60_g3108 [Sanghuangporus baumii]